jgi:hypothetical protein
MAEPNEIAVNAGEQVTNTSPTTLALKPEDQFRLINQRLDVLTGELTKLAAPPQFRLADGVQVGVIVLGLIVAGFTAFGLSERISDTKADVASAETRIKDSVNALEVRLGTRLEKLSDQFNSMNERAARLEGQLEPKKPK